MIVLYTMPGCNASRRAKTYLKENDINFIEKNIFKVLLNDNELSNLLSISDDVYDKNKVKSNDIINTLRQNPSLINKTIVTGDYSNISEEIIHHLIEISRCDHDCPHFEMCRIND